MENKTKRNRGFIFAAALGAAIGLIGCASAPAPVAAPETVGTLTESATHVAQAPVHATTDFAPAAAVADTGDDVPAGKTSLDVLRGEVASSGAVVAAPKEAHGF